jgi:two-component system, sensor histidine kinase RpfC
VRGSYTLAAVPTRQTPGHREDRVVSESGPLPAPNLAFRLRGWNMLRLHRRHLFPVTLALITAGVLPPVGIAALPGGMAMLGAPRTGIVLLAALLFVPAIVGLAVALQGFDAVLARLRQLPGGEYRQIVARVLLGGLIIAYLLGLLVARPDQAAIARCVLIGSLNLASAWLFLLSVILDPRASVARSSVALVSDLTLLSILLATGGGLAAPLAPIYIYIEISNGEHHGKRRFASAAVLAVLEFSAVVAVTPFWQENLLLGGGTLATMALLPAYVAVLLGRLDAARAEAEAANSAKNRFLAALGEDLRAPLRTLARVGAASDPSQADMLARIRTMARSMLLQLDDVLNYVKIDAGEFVPEARSFDLYRLANGVVAALRASAAERGITLALRIDPLLPLQLRGWPNQVRQILNCLITNTICHSGKVKVRINLDAMALDAGEVTVSFRVATGVLDDEFDGVGEAGGIEIERHLALSVADRLIRLMGGRLAVHADRRRGLSLAVELPFAIDQASLAQPPDLAHLPVMIVSKDAELVGELFEPFEAWRAAPRWIGAGDDALAYLEAMEPATRRPVLVLDGRGDVLAALNWVHRARSLLKPPPPQILFIVDEARIDSVIGLAADEIDIILPAPFSLEALRGASHALWVEPADWFLNGSTPIVEAFHRQPALPAIQEPAAETRVSPSSARRRQRPSAPPTSPRRRQILIATSNSANRKIMASLFARAGHVVRLAETSDEAQQLLAATESDLLLLDLTGAVEADYEAVRRCRRMRPSLMIVALAGDSSVQAERRAREAGIDAVLPKPVEPKRLLAAIDAVLEGGTVETQIRPDVRASVTDLSSHPRFSGDGGATMEDPPADPSSLVSDRRSPQDAVGMFRVNSGRLIADIGRAARIGDVDAFDMAVQALSNRAADVGAGRLTEMLQSMRGQTPALLRLYGTDYVAGLEVEMARLDKMLADQLKASN